MRRRLQMRQRMRLSLRRWLRWLRLRRLRLLPVLGSLPHLLGSPTFRCVDTRSSSWPGLHSTRPWYLCGRDGGARRINVSPRTIRPGSVKVAARVLSS
jgi:hypothetical protein